MIRLVNRRDYTSERLSGQAILHDWVVPLLGVTISRYVGKAYAIRLGGRRIAIDFGRYSFLFWGLAPRRGSCGHGF